MEIIVIGMILNKPFFWFVHPYFSKGLSFPKVIFLSRQLKITTS